MGKRSPERRFTQIPRPATELGRQGAAQLVSERSEVLRRCAPDSILPSLDWLWEQVQRGLQLGFVWSANQNEFATIVVAEEQYQAE